MLPLLASLARKRQASAPAKDGQSSHKDGGDAVNAKKMPLRKAKAKMKAKKGAPMEVSSRRATPPPRAAAARSGAKLASMRPRDPRFEDSSGTFSSDGFGKAYSFLEEYRAEELEKLKEAKQRLQELRKKRPKDSMIAAREDEIAKEIKRRVQQDKQRRHIGRLQDAERVLKAEERQKVKETGKVPYFHRKKAARQLLVEKKKKEEKGKTGRHKLEERREKKLAAREKKKIPTRRV